MIYSAYVIKMFLLFLFLAFVYYFLFYYVTKENYYWNNLEINPDLPIKIFTNNCQILIQQDSKITTPTMRLFYYVHSKGTFGADSFEVNQSANSYKMYADCHMESCMFRIMIPISQNSINPLEIVCKGTCVIKKIGDNYLYIPEVSVHAHHAKIYFSSVTLDRLHTESYNLFLSDENSTIKQYCLYAVTAIIEMTQPSHVTSFSYYLTGHYDYEAVFDYKKGQTPIHLQSMPKSCPFTGLDLKLRNLEHRLNKINPTEKLGSFETPNFVLRVVYGSDSSSDPVHTFFIGNLSIKFERLKFPTTQLTPSFIDPLGQSLKGLYEFVPPVEPKVRELIKEYVEESDLSKILVIMVKFNDIFNSKNQNLVGVFITSSNHQFLLSLFLKKKVSLLSDNLEIKYLDISLFRQSTPFDPMRSPEVLKNIRNEIDSRIHEVMHAENEVYSNAIDLSAYCEFYLLNFDNE